MGIKIRGDKMERYITADEAIQELEKEFSPFLYYKIVRAISSTRTADVRLDIHGKWIVDEDGNLECSICGHHGVGDLYCERCGAKMDKRLE